MSDVVNTAGMLKLRQNMYSFLSDVFLFEIDNSRLAALKAIEFPSGTGVEALDEGYALLQSFLSTMQERDLENLAVDYARTFLSAGVAQGLAAFPYQSVYVDDRKLMAQEPASRLGKLYAAKGLRVSESMFHVPNDHIGLALAFMSRLCDDAATQGGCIKAQLDEQKSFLNDFILNWYGGFCEDIEKYAQTDFYKAIAKITAGFLSLEQQLIETEVL